MQKDKFAREEAVTQLTTTKSVEVTLTMWNLRHKLHQ